MKQAMRSFGTTSVKLMTLTAQAFHEGVEFVGDKPSFRPTKEPIVFAELCGTTMLHVVRPW